ncbi:Flp pilus assembly protein CpaB [Aureimonas populi]|uniref:Flp pilus assembly protein CpaB n=1 Tax=Aureimonas populi TaxID=1701758 RepID=A0ABW5CM97_9HYPH|nr:Flp pilus assembly protein CpaB [Aureimonas populi]
MGIARLAVLGLSLAAAVGAGLIAVNLATPEVPEPVIISAQPVEPPIRLVEVLVTARELPMGARIDDAMSWQKWPEDGVGETLILRDARPNAMEELKGSVARQSFFAGEPVREAKLIETDRGFMSAILPSGKRAVAVSIAADTSAGGFILPNDHVDVIMTRQLGDRFDTETIMQNLRVLAIDQTIEEQNGERVVVGSTATLEVDPAQAEALTVAQRMADRLVLSLRSLSDSVPGSPGYAEFLLNQEEAPQRSRIRLVRYGQTTDITTTTN